MTPVSLIDEALKKYRTDLATAKALGINRVYISLVRSGKKKLSPLQSAKLARLLGHDPTLWAVIALREQAKSKKDREFWQSLLEKK